MHHRNPQQNYDPLQTHVILYNLVYKYTSTYIHEMNQTNDQIQMPSHSHETIYYVVSLQTKVLTISKINEQDLKQM